MMISVALFLFTTVHAAPAAPPDAFLDQPMPRFVSNTKDEFGTLCHQLRIPCGSEIYAVDFFQPDNFSVWKAKSWLDLENVTPRAVLELTMSRHPGYRWEFKDGVLLMFPDKKNKRAPQFFKTISTFTVVSEGVVAAGCRLGEIANLHCGSESIVATRSLADVENERASRSKKLNLALKGRSVQDILDALVAANGHAIWIYENNEGLTKSFEYKKMMGPHHPEERDPRDQLYIHPY